MRLRTCLTWLGLAAPLMSASPACAQVLNPANGHYYQVVTAPNSISWLNARTAAAAMSYLGQPGHLATITSAAENSFLVSTFGGSLLSGKDLGGFQPAGSAEPGGGWTWITGEAWGYQLWNGGEPNNGGGDTAENALQFAWNASDGSWNDIPATAVGGSFGGTPFYSGYVVEFESVPEPASGLLLATAGACLLLLRRRR